MKKISLFLSLLFAFTGAAKAQAQALTKVTGMPESGIYVIYGTTEEATPKKGYLRHDVATSNNRNFRLFDNVNLADNGVSAEDAEILKFCWLLMKNDDGSYTMQNMSTTTYIPADAAHNQNMTSSELANIMLQAVNEEMSDDDNSLWYAYQTNHKYSEKFAYIHSNSCTTDGANGNLSYWEDISGTSVRLTFYSLSETQENAVVAAAVGNYETLVGEDNYVGAVKTPKCLKDLKANPTKQNLINFMSPMTFDANVYYRVVCVGPKTSDTFTDVSHTALSRGTAEGTVGKAVADVPSQSDVDQIWQFVSTPDGANNSYYLKNLNNDKYLNPLARQNYRAQFVTKSEAGVFEILSHNDNTVGQYMLHKKYSEDTRDCLFCENNPNDERANDRQGAYTLSSFHTTTNSKENNASAWWLYPVEDIEMKLNSADEVEYWGTGYMPFAVTAADAEIYTATRSDNVLNLTEATKGVQATQGFIVKGTAETAKLNVLYETEVATSELATSQLGGTLVGESNIDTSNYYVLSYHSGEGYGVGFYHPRDNELLANKAYLQAGSGENANMLRFDFGGTTTAIGAVQGEPSADEALYDLSGRRVTTPVRGIYVKGGKKVLMR